MGFRVFHAKITFGAGGTIPITKNNTAVTVVSAEGEPLAPTYAKRARGLIKNGRAVWDGGVLRMLAPARAPVEGESGMDYEKPANNGRYEGYMDLRLEAEAPAPRASVADELYVYVAKENQRKRKEMSSRIWLALLVGFATTVMVNGMYNSDNGIFLWLIVNSVMCIRAIVGVLRYFWPSFRGGIGRSLRERRERALRFEVERLKSLDADALRREVLR
jgi:hypothetical protein